MHTMDQTVNQRTLVMLDRVNSDISTLNKRFENVITLAPIDGKGKNVTATEVFQIEVHATAMIRAAEDLLALTRSLKEAWLFGQLGSTTKEERTGTEANAKEAAQSLLAWYKKSADTVRR